MKDFTLNQLLKQLNSFYNLKITTHTLPKISTMIFKLITSELATPVLKNYRSPKKTIQLGYPTSLIKTGGKRLFLYDINSLYPFCFINKFPSEGKGLINQKYMIITKARITPPNFSRILYSQLPNNDNVDVLYSPQEVTLLTRLGYTFEITDQLRLPYRTDITLDFVIHLFSRKAAHPKLIKQLLNSFYGKIISSEPSVAASLILQHMISYARIYTHKIKLNLTNLSFYTDTDSFTVQHPFKAKPSQKLGYSRNLLMRTKIYAADSIRIISARNYSYRFKNQKRINNIGVDYTPKSSKKPFYRLIFINNREVNSISIIEFIYN